MSVDVKMNVKNIAKVIAKGVLRGVKAPVWQAVKDVRITVRGFVKMASVVHAKAVKLAKQDAK